MRIQEARENIGKEVINMPFAECKASQLEIGIIVRVTHQYVGVRYGMEERVKSTRARDIKLLK